MSVTVGAATAWSQVPTDLPNPDVREFAQFGAAVDVEGDVAIVGAPFDRTDGVWTGGAHVFRRGPDGGWALEATLRPVGFDPLSETQFGAHVAISGDVAAVSAPAERVEGPSGDTSPRGVVYVFRRGPGRAWALETELTQAPAGQLRYGAALDLVGDTLVVGARDAFAGLPGQGQGQARVAARPGGLCEYGDAYEPARVEVVRYDGAAWVRTDSLVAPDGRIGTGFGAAVSLDGGVLAVGAPFWYTARLCDEPEAFGLGRAYVFRQSEGGWAAEATLVPDGLEDDDGFGTAVAVSGGRVVVGAPLFDGAAFGSGAAFSYVSDGGAWAAESRFVGEGTVELDRFGAALDLEGDYVVVGSPGVRADGALGATYGFRRVGGAWAEGFRVTVDVGARPVPGGALPLGLGEAVALDGSTVLIGAPLFADYGANGDLGAGSVREIGRAYSYTLAQYFRLALTTEGEGTPAAAAVSLRPPWPNPASVTSTASFALDAPAHVRLDVVDALGRTVRTVVDSHRDAGPHEVQVDLGGLAAGTYLLRLQSGGRVLARGLAVAR